MGRHRVKQTALAEAAGLRYATVNALYNGKTERVDFSTLAAVLDGLNTLTGKSYGVADLLEYSEKEATQDAVLLEAGQADLSAQLAELEADIPPADLEAWSGAFR